MSDPWDALENPYEIFLRDVQEGGLENSIARRYYAKYEALVISNVDPSCQGRVKIRVFALDLGKAIDVWAYPSSPFAGPDYGFYFPPEPGDNVWGWFEHGDPGYPAFSGGWWLAPKRDKASSQVPNEFKELIPTKRGIKTKRGHALLFDDTVTAPKVELWSGSQLVPGEDAIKKNVFTMSDEPGQERITLETLFGQSLKLIDSPAGEAGVVLETLAGIRLFFDETLLLARLETPAGREVILDDLGASLSLLTPTGSIEINDASQTLDILSTGQVNITGTGVNIISPVISATTAVQTAGVSVITEDVNITYLKTKQEQITGAATLTFLSGLMMAATGAMAIGSVLTTVTTIGVGLVAPAAIMIGALIGIYFRLMTEKFLVIYNANVVIHNLNVIAFNSHIHPFVGNFGVPSVTLPTPAVQLPVISGDPEDFLTTTTVAN